MFALVAVLMFAGALTAAAYAVYSTVIPALPKIQAALAGQGNVSMLPPLPPRRVTTLRVTMQPATTRPAYWRAAA